MYAYFLLVRISCSPIATARLYLVASTLSHATIKTNKTTAAMLWFFTYWLHIHFPPPPPYHFQKGKTKPTALKTVQIQATNTYDKNGNMISDANKGISAITYNYLNLPVKVSFGTNRFIDYIYDTSGIKQQKAVTEGSSLTTTQYAGNYIYENNNLQFFNHAEGYVEPVIASGSAAISSFNYVYQYKDHLGNIRLSYTDADGNGAIKQDEIIEENNYYPFGLKHKGYNNVQNGRDHKYGFGGKEEQDDNVGGSQLNWHDFGARNYDAAIGRWMNIDALSEKYLDYSPYNYTLNNPILYTDPDGNDLRISFIGDNKEEAKKAYMDIVNMGLEGQFTAKLTEIEGEDGMYDVSFEKIADVDDREGSSSEGSFDNLSDQGKAFYNEMSSVINDKENVVSLTGVYGKKSVHVGKYKTGEIDLADMKQFNKTGRNIESIGSTQIGKMAHETSEQYYRVKNDIPLGSNMSASAHREGIRSENAVNNGWDRTEIPLRGSTPSKIMRRYTNKKLGLKTIVTIFVGKRNVISVKQAKSKQKKQL